jgi:hypothetical protein
MKTIALHKLGKIAALQICPRKRYFNFEHLETGIEPARLLWLVALEEAIGAAIQDDRSPDTINAGIGEILARAEKPGIRGITETPDPPAAAFELGRLAVALVYAWRLRRAPIISRSRNQPASLIICCSQNQPAIDRPDSRIFDLLLEEDSVHLEYFVTGHKWNGFRFMNPLLYFWRYENKQEITWLKPLAKATCYEPTSLEDWIQTLDKGNIDPIDQDAIATVILGGKEARLEGYSPEHLMRIEEQTKIFASEVLVQIDTSYYEATLRERFPQYFHSCRGCDFEQICFGPNPCPKDATEAYPGIYRKRLESL